MSDRGLGQGLSTGAQSPLRSSSQPGPGGQLSGPPRAALLRADPEPLTVGRLKGNTRGLSPGIAQATGEVEPGVWDWWNPQNRGFGRILVSTLEGSLVVAS